MQKDDFRCLREAPPEEITAKLALLEDHERELLLTLLLKLMIGSKSQTKLIPGEHNRIQFLVRSAGPELIDLAQYSGGRFAEKLIESQLER